MSRAITDDDTRIDAQWFAEHPKRSCYARATGDAVLVIRRIPQGRDAPVLRRVWAPASPVPEDEASCLALWERWS